MLDYRYQTVGVSNIVLFPYSNTPMWEYLLSYCKYREKGEGVACIYVETHVPEPLKDQVYKVGKQMLEHKKHKDD